MENASKALLIAGAILICILLIGVGMLVYNGALNGILGGMSSIDANTKEQFNSAFTQYEGKKSGANARAVIGNIITSNSTNQEEEGKLVSLVVETTPYTATPNDLKMNEMSKAKSNINTGAYYNIELEYNTSTGLVNKVKITKANN